MFGEVIENMRLLAERKQGRLGYSFLLMQRFDDNGRVVESNYDEVYAAGKLAKEIGCDYFELKAMLDDDHYTVNQSQADIALVEEQWARLETLTDESFHLLRSTNWLAVRSNSDAVQVKDYTSCSVAELRTTVTPTGVFICPYHRGNEKAKLGDLRDTESFTELWKQADVAGVDPRQQCQFHCARHETNLAIRSLRDNPVPVELVPDFDPFI